MGPNRMPDAMSVRQKWKSGLPETRIRALRLRLVIRLDGKCRLFDKRNRTAAVQIVPCDKRGAFLVSMRIYRVSVRNESGDVRDVTVPSKTDVQAADAAGPLMKPGEEILDVVEIDDPFQRVDAPPPGTQTHPDWIT